MLLKEVRGHVLHSGGCNGRDNIISIAATLRRHQVDVKVPGYQKCSTVGALSDGRGNAFDGNYIVGGKVTPDNKPALSYRFYLKYQNVRPVRLQRLDLEVGGVLVEDRHPPGCRLGFIFTKTQ